MSLHSFVSLLVPAEDPEQLENIEHLLGRYDDGLRFDFPHVFHFIDDDFVVFWKWRQGVLEKGVVFGSAEEFAPSG